MANPEKVDAVAEITDMFRESDAAVITEYRGLSVGELKELRRSLGSETTYAVVKNTLTEIAAREVLSLPVHPSLDAEDLDRIVTAVNALAKAGA